MEAMTVLSKEMFECAVHMTSTRDATRVLLEYRQYRTFGDTLRAFANNSEPKRMLVDALLLWNPSDKRDSVDRKVRNWLSGKTQSIDKHTAFILCRILELSLEKANEFLKLSTGEGIHWRQASDIVWSYAIVHQLSPESTLALLEKAQALEADPDKTAPASPNAYTASVYEKLQNVLYQSEDDLLAFLKAEQANLGALHNTAYEQFMRSLTLLEQGFADADVENLFREMTQQEKRQKEADARSRRETACKEAGAPHSPLTISDLDGDTELFRPESLSSRDILETYLYRSLVPVSDRAARKNSDPYAAIRRSIRQSWPDAFTLSRMKNRQIDVSRKVLILLFLATDGSGTAFEGMDEDEALYTEDDLFQDVYTRLNLMLTSCGFLQLDPRSAFDWMVLYCISAGDLWASDERLQSILQQMFPEESV